MDVRAEPRAHAGRGVDGLSYAFAVFHVKHWQKASQEGLEGV
jgi:hypothetical protein